MCNVRCLCFVLVATRIGVSVFWQQTALIDRTYIESVPELKSVGRKWADDA